MKIQNVNSSNYRQQTFNSALYKPTKVALQAHCGKAIAASIEGIKPSLENLAKTEIEGLPEGVAVILVPEGDIGHALGIIVRDDVLNTDVMKSLVPLAGNQPSPYQQMLDWCRFHYFKDREYGRMYLGYYSPSEFGKELVRTVQMHIERYRQKIQRQVGQLGKKD